MTLNADLNRRTLIVWGAAASLALPVCAQAAQNDPIADAILTNINTARSAAGLQTLNANRKLDRAARGHALAMAKANTLTHTFGKSDPTRRAKRADYEFRALAENIGLWPAASRDADTAAALVAAWRASPDHAANILNGTYKHSGIGTARNGNTVYAVQMFGIPR